jgi:hypothetical protein
LLVNALQLGQKKEKNSDLGFENFISKWFENKKQLANSRHAKLPSERCKMN